MTATAAPAKLIPGPRSFPVVGGKPNFIRFVRSPFTFTQALYRTYGPVAGIGQGDSSFVFVAGPDLNYQVLTNPSLFENSSGLFQRLREDTALKRLLLNNLAAMNGAHHKQQRHLIQPAFHKKHVMGYHSDMVALTEAMLTSWRGQDTVELLSEMKHLIQHIAVKTLIGADDPVKLKEVSSLFRRMGDATASPFLLLPLNLPGLPYRRMLQLGDEFEAYIRSVIDYKRHHPDDTDVLATLMRVRDEDGSQLSEQELIGHSFTLFGAGTTTSHALTWTFFLLDQHPHVALALVDEVASVCQGSAPTVEQLEQMPLLEQVIKESMRLFPPAPLGLRVATEACELGDYAITKGANIFFNQMITHRLPDLYPLPNHFMPCRWETYNPTTYEYLPFGAGVHMCIGISFAMQAMKVVLAVLLQRHRLALVPGGTINTNLGMRATPGVPVRIYPQDRRYTRSTVKGKAVTLVDGIE